MNLYHRHYVLNATENVQSFSEFVIRGFILVATENVQSFPEFVISGFVLIATKCVSLCVAML